MSVHEISRRVDGAAKVEIVVLGDDYGGRHIVQHPLLRGDHDHEAVEAKEKREMRKRELAFERICRQRGHDLKKLRKGKAAAVPAVVAPVRDLENCEGCGDKGNG
jgi:hypothetical protein